MRVRKGVDRLPSGRYRYRLTENGLSLSFTEDRLLSAREARQRFTRMIAEAKDDSRKGTFGEASSRYIKGMGEAYSISTITFYSHHDKILKRDYPGFYRMPLGKISADDIQTIASDYGQGRAPLSVKSLIDYIQTVLHRNDIYLRQKIKIGQIKAEAHIPTAGEVKLIFEAVKDTDMEIPVKLAALGLRRAEICGLDINDFDGEYITIHRTRVMSDKGPVYQERTKTALSRRRVLLTEDLKNLIRERKEICNIYPTHLDRKFSAIVESLGIQKFTLHKLRHFYASQAHALGVPTAFIMRSGGWETPAVLERTYTHALADEQRRNDLVTVNFLDSLVTNP